MKTFIHDLETAIRTTLVFTLLLCGAFPVAIWGVSQLLFPHQANGSLLQSSDGQIIGSEWLGQNFTSPKYFHPRPSAAGSGYDATSSSGTNLGPTSQKLMDNVKAAVAQYRADNGLAANALVPGDAVTSSASGLDPHISVANAQFQAARVARERRLGVEAVQAAIAQNTDGRSLGVFGEPGVNVLKLNLALDAIPK